MHAKPGLAPTQPNPAGPAGSSSLPPQGTTCYLCAYFSISVLVQPPAPCIWEKVLRCSRASCLVGQHAKRHQRERVPDTSHHLHSPCGLAGADPTHSPQLLITLAEQGETGAVRDLLDRGASPDNPALLLAVGGLTFPSSRSLTCPSFSGFTL